LHWVGCCILKSDFMAKVCGNLLKIRLDNLLVERGIIASPEKAQALILAGRVLVDEQRATKAGVPTEQDASIRLLGDERKYVSRGGLKLEKALEHWKIDVQGKTCLDVGASTGGFTDCLLQHDAARVIAVDTGYGQIDFRLRQDTRVQLLENTNARYLSRDQLGFAIDFIAIDVSFISATSVLPAVINAAFPDPAASKQMVILVKPQFEADREQVEKGGIVRNPEAQSASVEKVRNSLLNLHCKETDVIESPILGAEGNREFLLYGLF
jgi:23S rRNA (cytidine1920-2'-O)/16S rRNA (cytidine1409-2'-O)-methyltransferase